MAQRNGQRRTGTPGETRGLPRAEGEGESCTREAREVEGGYEKRWSKSDYIYGRSSTMVHYVIVNKASLMSRARSVHLAG